MIIITIYYNLFLEYIDRSTPEGRFVSQLDKLEMVIQALEYEKEHEPEKLEEFWEYTKARLEDPELVKLFEELISLRRKKS